MLKQLGSPAAIEAAVSRETDPERAVAELAEQLRIGAACFVLIFVPDGLCLDDLGAALKSRFSGVPVFGCTTAGQITQEGYETGALLAIAFPKSHFRCASMLIAPLNPLSIKDLSVDARRLSTQFQKTAHWNRFALTFVDGLAKQEDFLVAALVTALDEIPVFGGSAGNGLHFRETRVLHGGKFHTNAAVLIILETDLEITGLGFDHFLPTDKQMVVTDAVPEERLVLEINGAPAAEEYARLVGCAVEDLSPRVFAENPVLVRNRDLFHVRAIQGVQDNSALSFFSAIDDGLLLTLGKGTEILETLETGLSVRGPGGSPPELVLGFDCILRKLEIEQKQLTREASRILRHSHVLGFNTYGEQHCGVHVSQTFVGVAFFEPKRRDLH